MRRLLDKIARKLEHPDLVNDLSERLSGSEFNSLLLSVFRQRAKSNTPAQILRAFADNRFVRPARVDALSLLQLEMNCLQRSRKQGFSPILLSPLAPLGTCAAVSASDQHRTVSALRGTEVVSDATNVLALQIARDFQEQPQEDGVVRYSTTHRQVRAQAFDHPLFTAHFALWCLASGGYDTGNFEFEIKQLAEHLQLHYGLLQDYFNVRHISTFVYLNSEHSQKLEAVQDHLTALSGLPSQIEYISGHDREKYYHSLRFKIFIDHEGERLHLVDGGTVDWTQQLLSNNKHRLFTSASGLELICTLTKEQHRGNEAE